MTASLIILLSLVTVGTLLYIHHRWDSAREAQRPVVEPPTQEPESLDEECCGMHITCEKDSLLASVSDKIVYYDDEELDAYRGRKPEEYAESEVEEFRDVLLTLLPVDIAGWARSLQLRGISLPADVREELLMIVSEARAESIKQ